MGVMVTIRIHNEETMLLYYVSSWLLFYSYTNVEIMYSVDFEVHLLSYIFLQLLCIGVIHSIFVSCVRRCGDYLVPSTQFD
jgi:hypothetical protein